MTRRNPVQTPRPGYCKCHSTNFALMFFMMGERQLQEATNNLISDRVRFENIG